MINHPRPGQLPRDLWRKSSHSGTAGNCIEVAELGCGYFAVRDSKDSAGPVLTFNADEWSSFTAWLRAGSSTDGDHGFG